MSEIKNPRERLVLAGETASPGTAAGPALLFRPVNLEALERNRLTVTDPARELTRFSEAVGKSKQQLQDLSCRGQGNTAMKDIFDAQVRMMEDTAFLGQIETALLKKNANIEHVLAIEIQNLEKVFAPAGSPALRDRFLDIQDAYHRILRNLLEIEHVQQNALKLASNPFILVAESLLPSDVAVLETGKVLGLVLEKGSRVSHAAILCRSLGIPAVIQVPGLFCHVRNNDAILLDGRDGRVVLRPTRDETEAARKKHDTSPERSGPRVIRACKTSDNVRIRLEANIGSIQEAASALAAGADGVGLFRTEFYYMSCASLPSLEEESAVYESVLSAMGGRPVTFRLLDLGADKGLPFLRPMREDNPQLGVRGLRYLLQNPGLLTRQLQALVRASRKAPLRLLLPFVAVPAEAYEAFDRLNAICDREGADRRRIKIGVMVEIPSMALAVESILDTADFISLGTNDLTQYLFAADRENDSVQSSCQPHHPLIFRLIAEIVRKAKARKKEVSVCGELASEPAAAAILAGMGVRTLSMTASSFAGVSGCLTQTSMKELRNAAKTLLSTRTEEEAEAVLAKLKRNLA